MKKLTRVISGLVIVSVSVALGVIVNNQQENNISIECVYGSGAGSFVVHSAQNFEDSLKSIAKIESDRTSAMGLSNSVRVRGDNEIIVKFSDGSSNSLFCVQVK